MLDIADQSPFSIAAIGVEWCKAQGIHFFPQFSLPRNAFEAVSPVFPQTVTFPLHRMCRSGSDECPMRRDKEYRMLNNILAHSFRPLVVNVTGPISARARPLNGGLPFSVPPRHARRVGQGGDRDPRPPQPFGRWPNSMTIWRSPARPGTARWLPGTFSLETHLIWQQGDEA